MSEAPGHAEGSEAVRADGGIEVAASPEQAATDADAVLVATEWPEYGQLDWRAIAQAMRGYLGYDTRAGVDPAAVTAAGLRLERLGRP